MKILNALLLGALVFGAAEVLFFSPEKSLYWTPPTTDINGNPETVIEAEIGIWLSGADPAIVQPLFKERGISPLGTGYQISKALAGRTPGTYDLRVRVSDSTNNWSAWSDPLSGVYDSIPPKPPTGLSCK
jgi:hypothetical protein